jgi:hypothetical protein
VYRPIEQNTPIEYLQELKGLADGAGLDYRIVYIGNYLSDLNMALLEDDALLTQQECSDFETTGPATVDGKMNVGRNTDYFGQGRWMKYQTIFFYGPKDQRRYVKVSSFIERG